MHNNNDDHFSHIGTKYHSGRYPWGSGGDAYQRGSDFFAVRNKLMKSGMSDADIAKAMGMTTNEYRARRQEAKAAVDAHDYDYAFKMLEKGHAKTYIAQQLGCDESRVRYLLKKDTSKKKVELDEVKDSLRSAVDKDKYIEIGDGTEALLGISKPKFKSAIQTLKDEGYKVHYLQVQQLGTAPGNKTTVTVMTKGDVDWREVKMNQDKIRLVGQYFDADTGRRLGLEKPRDISSKNVVVRYKEDGGIDKDGVIEVRRGVPELDMGNKSFVQARISVDGTHYLKGMVVYGRDEDFPPGVNVIFNTNKSKSVSKMDVFKKQKVDPSTGNIDEDNPFGATVAQRKYKGKNGKEELSALNIVNEEGNWDNWGRNLAGQMLSKQHTKTIKQQLDITKKDRLEEFERIMSIPNDVVRKRLLRSFADECDSDAVTLKAAPLPGQTYKVILPVPSIKENEIYAPTLANGTRVALVRYPHGGTFEIPDVVVNNKNPEAKRVIGNSPDGIGIHPKVAERLSGADFDGDSVVCIPNNRKYITSTPALKSLEGYDPKVQYAVDKKDRWDPETNPKGKKMMGDPGGGNTQKEMGMITNLIADMTIRNAKTSEIARAVKHSMCVIDAEKHGLDHKRSATENGIKQLKEMYQGKSTGGASTLITQASSEQRVSKRDARYKVDPETGKKIYNYKPEYYYKDKKTGQIVREDKDGNLYSYDPVTKKKVIRTDMENIKQEERLQKSKKMFEAEDAYSLSSGTKVESLYAEYANEMKALGNRARKEWEATSIPKANPQAKKDHPEELNSLETKLKNIVKNRPFERQAQIIANTVVDSKLDANPHLDAKDIKKIKGQAITAARERVGSNRTKVTLTPEEWQAIEKGVLSGSKLTQLIDRMDIGLVQEYATPRVTKTLPSAKKDVAKARIKAGYTLAEVADSLGVPVSMLKDL